jgi:phosphoribosylaminoimidazole-succinocarboxamide synthase
LAGQLMPDLPATMVDEISARYIELYELITGSVFVKDTAAEPLLRIEHNLRRAGYLS